MQQLSYSLSEGYDREYKIKVEGGKKGNPLYMHHLTSYSAIMTVIHDSQAFSKELGKRLKPLSVSHAAKHQFPLIQRAETKALNRTVTDQSQAGEGCLCPSNKVTEKTFTLCRSSTPPSVCEETQSDSLR